MLFCSLTFIFIFFPIVLFLYFITKKLSFKNLILLVASLVFYAWGEPIYIFLMLLTVGVSYIFGLLINHYDNKKKYNHKKVSLILSILFIIGILGFFKYGNFVIDNINTLFNFNIDHIDFKLPIGISFYSFQILSYLIDLYKKEIKVQKNVFDLALYVSLFPQLIAGPIVRYQTIENELSTRKTTLNDVVYGIKRFIVGLSKKVLIANQMGLIADTIFDYPNIGEFGTLIIWMGALAYTFQIYFDFSGYSDMAIGLGRIFGFKFLENFNFPYISKSVTEFWRRWHISLSSWFRDYIYIPLGGNRVKKGRWILNILIVWLLTGLWHGANWNFIFWGLYFGLILLFEKLYFNKILNKLPNIIKWLYTFILIVIGWVIFRNTNTNNIFLSLERMFIYTPSDLKTFIIKFSDTISTFIYFIPAIIFSFPSIDLCKERKNNLVTNAILLFLFLMCVTFLVSSSYNPFIYFRF